MSDEVLQARPTHRRSSVAGSVGVSPSRRSPSSRPRMLPCRFNNVVPARPALACRLCAGLLAMRTTVAVRHRAWS